MDQVTSGASGMRIAPWPIVAVIAVIAASAALALAGPASAQQADPKPAPPAARPSDHAYANFMRRVSLVQRAHELRPQRRDEPLRYLNITDNEVREIQVVAEKFVPKSIVNISPVVTGCPCEEGPQCTEQVYIVANGSDRSTGLQLSRLKNAWTVGVVQQWWHRYDALRARRSTMDPRAYDSLESELLRELPQCVGEWVPAEASTTNLLNEEKK
jgi:hypothetical protein